MWDKLSARKSVFKSQPFCKVQKIADVKKSKHLNNQTTTQICGCMCMCGLRLDVDGKFLKNLRS